MIAIAAVATCGAVAAVASTGPDTHSRARAGARGAHHGNGAHHRGAGGGLSAAARYLEIPVAKLRSELLAGKSLAQLANATSGKSAAGLEAALVATKKARLAAAIAKLPQRVSAEVDRAGGPRSLSRARADHTGTGASKGQIAPRRAGQAAAGYLNVPAGQLHEELRSGKTLAQIANATPGKSAAGLEAALVAARKEQLAAAVSTGALSKAREQALIATLPQRVRTLVNR